MPRSLRPLPPLCALPWLAIACGAPAVGDTDTPSRSAADALSTPATIESSWAPDSGRGTIRVRRADGARVEIDLQLGYEGYTGGLLLGSMGQPAYRLWPAAADDDADPVAIWCAQDESIVVDGVEYSHGWSENIGLGGDGVPLRYLGGAVLEAGDDRLLLVAHNGAPPLRITRWLRVLPDDGTLLVRQRLDNEGTRPLTFALWSGEDPWVGTYGTSEGDVGWVSGDPARIPPTGARTLWNETVVEADAVTCVGVVDPGEQHAGRPAANAMCLAPDSPRPDAVLVANRFAHTADEIDPQRPLRGDTLTAFNLGWRDVTLAPGEAWELSYSLGVAGARDGPPVPPAIPADAWADLAAQPVPPELARHALADPLRFASEVVELELLPGGDEVEIRGSYRFVNAGETATRRSIFFPFAIDALHPYPHEIEVSSGATRRLRDGVVFPLEVAAGAEQVVAIRYRQRTDGATATYVVTSAQTWSEPLERAELRVILPAGTALSEVAYPMEGPRADGERWIWETTIERFFPDRELSVRWDTAGSAAQADHQ